MRNVSVNLEDEVLSGTIASGDDRLHPDDRLRAGVASHEKPASSVVTSSSSLSVKRV